MMMEKENKSALFGRDDKFRVCAWSGTGKLYVWSPYPVEAYLYTMNGQLYAHLELAAGRTETPVATGNYVVCIGRTSFKLTF